MTLFLFIVAAVLVLGGGLGVVTSRNIVHAALFLLVSLIAVAGIYLILFAEFLAIVQILIYGGAILIVLLFAIMLTRGPEYPIVSNNRQWPLAIITAIIIFGVISASFMWETQTTDGAHGPGLVKLGESLFTTWAIPFEIASVLLLVALIGAIIIAKAGDKD